MELGPRRPKLMHDLVPPLPLLRHASGFMSKAFFRAIRVYVFFKT